MAKYIVSIISYSDFLRHQSPLDGGINTGDAFNTSTAPSTIVKTRLLNVPEKLC